MKTRGTKKEVDKENEIEHEDSGEEELKDEEEGVKSGKVEDEIEEEEGESREEEEDEIQDEEEGVFKGWSDDSLKRGEKDEDRVGGFGGGHVIQKPRYNRVKKPGQSTKLNKPQKGEKVEDVVKVIKEKLSICEAAIKDLMESIKRIPEEEKMEPELVDVIHDMELMIGDYIDQLIEFLYGEKEWGLVNEMGNRSTVEHRGPEGAQGGGSTEDVDLVTVDPYDVETEAASAKEKEVETSVEEGLEENTPEKEETTKEEGMEKEAMKKKVATKQEEVKHVNIQNKGKRELRVKVKGPTVPPKEAMKRKIVTEEEELQNKRQKKAAEKKRSPFLNRIVRIFSNVTYTEKLCCAYIFTDYKVQSDLQQVWKNLNINATKAMLRSLDTVVDPNVINIWSFMMNKSELAKSG